MKLTLKDIEKYGTKEEQEKLLKESDLKKKIADPTICPFCGSADIGYGRYGVDERKIIYPPNIAKLDGYCDDCTSEWEVFYKTQYLKHGAGWKGEPEYNA